MLQEGERDRIAPGASASLEQRLPLGVASVGYERTVAPAGGLGGTTDNDAVAALLRITELGRDFALELAPRYDQNRVSLGLQVGYPSGSTDLTYPP